MPPSWPLSSWARFWQTKSLSTVRSIRRRFTAFGFRQSVAATRFHLKADGRPCLAASGKVVCAFEDTLHQIAVQSLFTSRRLDCRLRFKAVCEAYFRVHMTEVSSRSRALVVIVFCYAGRVCGYDRNNTCHRQQDNMGTRQGGNIREGRGDRTRYASRIWYTITYLP